MPERRQLIALTALALASCSKQSAPIEITGSSTIFPFTKAVADRFVQANDGVTPPVINEVGTVSGAAAFCGSAGAPDILDASRRMTRKEFDKCQANRVGEIMEIPIGLDGIALAESDAGPKLSITTKDFYLALAANPLGKPNTAKMWSDVNPKLPAIPIKVLGPPPSSGTRDSLVTLMLEPGCIEAMPAAAAMRGASDPAKFEFVCRSIRSDGPYVTAGEDDKATVKALEQNKDALGLFGYSYLEQSAGRLHGVPINGVTPAADTIARGEYKGGRLLYIYVKKTRLQKRPALQRFLDLYADMWKPGGPLVKQGLIAMSDKTARNAAAVVKNGFPIEADELY